MQNQQYYNNGFGGYNPNPNMGHVYGVSKPQAINSQPLTQEIANTLRQEGSEVNMKIDQRDLWRAMCTHKDPTNGQNTLIQNPDGTYTCSICGKTFRFFEGSTEKVKEAVDVLIDMLQTCKTIYLDAPVKMTEQYYQIICLLEKFPALWDIAVRNFSKYENVSNPLNPISNQYGGFNALGQLLTNPYGAQYYPQYGQPMMGQQPMYNPQQPMYGQPMMGQQPAYYPQMDNIGNPMACGGVPAAAPTAPMPGVMPNAPQAQAAPAVPSAPAAQNGEVQQQKVYNV